MSRTEVVVPVRHPGRWFSSAIAVLLVALVASSVATNPRFEWAIVAHYFFSPLIVAGLGLTLELTGIAMLCGIILGTLLAVMRVSAIRLLRAISWAYLWFFRGTPLLVQLIFWFNLAALYPTLGLGVPFGPIILSVRANAVITPFLAAILGLGLNEGAYMAEIVRAGLLSVDQGQGDAAAALGMSRLRTLRYVVLPQALRVIVPPTGNETIGMLKLTSLVSFIALPELLYSAELIYARTYQVIPLLIVASCWYLIFTTILTTGQVYLERRLARGTGQPEAPTSVLVQWLRVLKGHSQ